MSELPARFIRPSHVAAELVAVAYEDRSFPIHIHEEYVVGVIESGAEQLTVGRDSNLLKAGDLLTLSPFDAHANRSVGPGILRYRVFYLPSELVAVHLSRDGGRFAAAAHPKSSRSKRLLELHRWFERGDGDRLEQQSAIAEVIGIVFDQMSASSARPVRSRVISYAKEYIEAHYRCGFGLDELARAVGLSKFHLVRCFSCSYGLSPLAYRTQRRIVEAKRLVLAGTPLVEIAAETGFADQSHLTRNFQSIVGTSPLRYKEQ